MTSTSQSARTSTAVGGGEGEEEGCSWPDVVRTVVGGGGGRV